VIEIIDIDPAELDDVLDELLEINDYDPDPDDEDEED
jgi:hypothetical protein